MAKKEIKISIIAAVAKNGVIGNGGDIPWYLPSDFAFFKKTTLGKPIIMGRKTFDSIGKPLPKRSNIVISRDKNYSPNDVIVVDSIKGAIEKAKTIAKADSIDEIMIIGGAEIYRQAMPLANRLYISHVELSPKGDSFFPIIEKNEWEMLEQIEIEKSPRDSAKYKVMQYTQIS